MPEYCSISDDVKLGEGVKLSKFINLYGCSVGANTKLGAFVEIQKNAHVGSNCKISSHTFICEGVRIEDDAFVGHGVMFINDAYPRATTDGQLQTEADWAVEPTIVKKGASLGSNCTIMSNVTIGENAIVGAGSVVTKDVPPNTIVAGNPARIIRTIDGRGADDAKSQISITK
jgi:acetyltransferase-like isoleucine patch superfamily enzyme